MKKLLGAALLLVSLGGCAGYHLGPIQPYALRDVHSIAVPTFNNKTLLPRIAVLVTDTVIKQFQQDGTYRIAGDDQADAILKGDITRINRSPARSVRGNVLATNEFNLSLRVRYTLVERKTGKTLAAPVEVAGSTSFFVGPDITSDERQALPLAAEELAIRLVSQLSEGW
ncbi:MAG: LPS assembly lipoprotein LptE [Verrucomicrobiota bacterium]|nr:LptE family protein [Chthoniobacterales bacterium]MDQ3414321.1 LPS assembly lipoprotein LptE [Verrucomicrobiota bacterium]